MTLPRFNRRPTGAPVPPGVELFPPVADFSWEIIDGRQVHFFSNSVDPDGEIVRHDWSFGDSVTLPTARFTVSQSGLTVTVTNTSTAVSPATLTAWFWEFGDGSVSTSQNPAPKTYTAAGTYNIRLTVTDSDGARSLPYQLTIILGGATGVRLGAYSMWTSGSSVESVGTADIDCFIGTVPPNGIIDRINYCRRTGTSMLPNLAGGDDANYQTGGVFDPAKWEARILETAPAANEIREAVRDGIIPGAILMDEPWNKRWGGYFDTHGKPALDDMASFVKDIHPTLPVGPTHRPDHHDHQNYTVVDFMGSQYSYRLGTIESWYAGALAVATAGSHKLLLSANCLNGGLQMPWPCSAETTGGNGTMNGNCKMTAAQLEESLTYLASRTYGVLSIWRHDTNYFGRTDVQNALADVSAVCATLPRRSLRRGD
jgi:hypothetical protein